LIASEVGVQVFPIKGKLKSIAVRFPEATGWQCSEKFPSGKIAYCSGIVPQVSPTVPVIDIKGKRGAKFVVTLTYEPA
jgi:hypothetical protein